MSFPRRLAAVEDRGRETPKFHVQREGTFGEDISQAIQHALIARELAELTRSRLPWPFDPDAEWIVLAALSRARGQLRREVDPGWFFVPLHEAIARAYADVDVEPGDCRALAAELGRTVRGEPRELAEVIQLLNEQHFTNAQAGVALARVMQLADARFLIEGIEREARAARVEAKTPDEVRRALRALLGD